MECIEEHQADSEQLDSEMDSEKERIKEGTVQIKRPKELTV